MATEPVYFLLVDDLDENLIALEALLRRDDLIMLKARTGMEALELLLQYDIALALVDVQMPSMDGFELAELMRGKEKTKSVPIIFLTAGTTDQQRRFRGYEAGAVDFLQKPIETDILKSKTDVFFELHRRRQEVARQRDALEIATKKAHEYAEALMEANLRKDEFLATLAHELRNPLAPIRNGLYILRSQPVGDTADKVRDMMDRQLSHMVRLIDDLLDVSRISKGKIELRREKVNLSDAIQTALEIAKPHIDEQNHSLTLNLNVNDIWLNGDLTRLGQIIGNILNNAARYTPAGGHIVLSGHQDGDNAVITVTDNGVGIPPEMQSQIFGLFTQVDRKVEKAQGGLGIGLALSKSLIEMHGGEIRVASEGQNKGSTFTICIPVTTPPEEITQINEVKLDAISGDRHILIVDDNVASAQTTGWMLEELGYTYELAHSGPEALLLAQQMKPDAIMLDIGLPGMNGYDVCRELRKDPLFKDTVIIAQTGWGQKKDKDMAEEAGFDCHLTKPLSLDDIARALSV